MATGVLIVGVGAGTKSLSTFLECTKEYECVVLFGAATDTYDTLGKVVGRKSAAGVTKEKVERALAKFKGQIMQVPPIFSALRVKGKRMYEYAREGGEIPEMKPRPLTVEKMELVEWLEPGQHDFQIPDVEAPEEEKVAAEKLLHLDAKESNYTDTHSGESSSLKRKREEDKDPNMLPEPASPKKSRPSSVAELSEQPQEASSSGDPDAQNASETDITKSLPESSTSQPPGARIRMTVSSGFYVRSFCHDLGAAVGSLGLMAALVRTRQAQFSLGENVLPYDDLERGESVWEPKVQAMLQEWTNAHINDVETKAEDAEKKTEPDSNRANKGGMETYRRRSAERRKGRHGDRVETRRRNSSSDDG